MKIRSAQIALGCLVLSLVAGPVTAQAPPPAKPAESAIAVAPPEPSRPFIDRPDAAQQGCDGFGQMLPSGDGLTVATANIWRVGGNRMRGRPDVRNGIAYCDRALTIQSTEYPQFWQRRVSFLQARALHNIARSQLDAAAADIAAADAAAQAPDATHLRSLRLNTRFIEAYLLVERGDRAAGEAMAMQAWRERPYTRQTVGLALSAIGPQGDPANIETLLRAMGQIDPNSSILLYAYAFETGNFEKALALSGEVVPRRPLPPEGYDLRARIHHEENQRALDIRFWIDVLGRKAYALAAKGQADAANGVIADLEQRLAAATPAPAALPPRPNQEARTRAVVQEQVNLDIAATAPARLNAWRTLVRERIAVASGARAAASPERSAALTELGASYAATELMAASEGRTATPYTSADIYQRLNLPRHDAAAMFRGLLDGETAERTRTVLVFWDRIFANRDHRERGNCEEEENGMNAVVCDWAAESTMAISEERSLLRAARFAAAQGQPAFVVARRLDMQHSNVSTMYGVPMNEAQAGFSTTLTIDAHAAPAPDAPCWRCLDAAAVQASLNPIYISAPTATAARQ